MDITTKVLKYGTMFYINYEECKLRNRILVADYLKGFILTMRNVNVVGAGRIYTLLDVLY
ncbi:TPA: hypothetical protein I9008_001605 [Clostridium perfringens]|nr:hypothetical protein [Clostridium perfringens]